MSIEVDPADASKVFLAYTSVEVVQPHVHLMLSTTSVRPGIEVLQIADSSALAPVAVTSNEVAGLLYSLPIRNRLSPFFMVHRRSPRLATMRAFRLA
jgi:hypothetical protein